MHCAFLHMTAAEQLVGGCQTSDRPGSRLDTYLIAPPRRSTSWRPISRAAQAVTDVCRVQVQTLAQMDISGLHSQTNGV